mgnify:CR=1 FL=1
MLGSAADCMVEAGAEEGLRFEVDDMVEPGGKPEVRWVVNVLLPGTGDA